MYLLETFLVDFEIIKDYPNYMINRDGKIYSLNRNIFLKYTEDKDGYYKVKLCNNGEIKTVMVHRIVAIQFIENKDSKKNLINHKDGNKKNNNVENLEWVTSKENTQHAINTNLYKPYNEGNNNAKLSNEDVIKIRNMYENGMKISEIQKVYNFVTWENIKHIVVRRTFKNI